MIARRPKKAYFWVGIVIAILLALAFVYAFCPLKDLQSLFQFQTVSETISSAPHWRDLKPAQQELLEPLEDHWNKFTTKQKKKWLVIAKRMQKMTPEAREQFQNHIRDWLNLTSEERLLARQNFKKFRGLNPDQKAEHWNSYQQLSPEKKRALAARAKAKRKALAARNNQKNSADNKPSTGNQQDTESQPDYWN